MNVTQSDIVRSLMGAVEGVLGLPCFYGIAPQNQDVTKPFLVVTLIGDVPEGYFDGDLCQALSQLDLYDLREGEVVPFLD